MKILEVCMSKGFGGLELYVLKVAQFLARNAHQYNVLTSNKSFLSAKLGDNNLKTQSFGSVFHHFPMFSSFRLARYIDLNEIDVVHIHWGNDLFFAVLAKVLCRRKVKLVYTRQMALTRSKNDIYHRFLYRNVDAYLTITRALYDEAVRYLPLDKSHIHVLYYGVPEANLNKSICNSFIREAGMDDSIFRLAIFGRIEKGKGQHLVVEAVKNLKSQGINIQAAIIGHIMDNKYFKKLQNEIHDNKLESNVFYLGFHNQPTSIMPCFNAVVLATKCETFGLVLPEAMRAGVAVVGSDCGGVPEIILHEKTGLLFESENVDDLASQLEKLVNDPAFCQKLASEGKMDADERFSEEKHFAKLIEFFKTA